MPATYFKAPAGGYGNTRYWSQDWIDAVNKTPTAELLKNMAGYVDEATERQRYDAWKAKNPNENYSWDQWVRKVAKGYYPGRTDNLGREQTNVSVKGFDPEKVFSNESAKSQTPYDYYLNGMGGYGTPPPGSTPANTQDNESQQGNYDRTQEGYWKWLKEVIGPSEKALRAKFPGISPATPSYEDYLRTLNSTSATTPTTPPTTPQNPIPSNWMDVVNKAVGQKYSGATQYNPSVGTNPVATVGNSPAPASPAGNNITSGIVNPTANIGGTNLATTAPNTGTGSFSPDMSFLNPTSGTTATKRKTGANKYFNQQWFGGKQLA